MPSKKSLTLTAVSHKRKRSFVSPASIDLQTVPPLFVAQSLRKTIERMLPTRHHERLRKYFQIYGCFHCSKKEVLYGANGFCLNCIGNIGKRLRKIDVMLKARCWMPADDPDVRQAYLRPYNTARELLADLVPKSRRPEPKLPAAVYLKP